MSITVVSQSDSKVLSRRSNGLCNSKVLLIGLILTWALYLWDISSAITGKPDLQQHTLLLDMLNDHSLTQLNTSPPDSTKFSILSTIPDPGYH